MRQDISVTDTHGNQYRIITESEDNLVRKFLCLSANAEAECDMLQDSKEW